MGYLAVTLHPAVDKFVRTDRVVPDGIARVEVVSIYAGGKGNNVARTLVRLGESVETLSFNGGFTGAQIVDSLEKEGVTCPWVKCEAAIRISTLVHETETGQTYALYEPGQRVSEEEAQKMLDKFVSLIDSDSIVMLCGSGQCPNLVDMYGKMVEETRKVGARCLVDSSSPALNYAIDATPYLVKANEHEIGEYFQETLDTREKQVAALKSLMNKGISIAAMTLGPDGMIVTDGKECFHAVLKMSEVRNVVGCGDALLAGIAKAIGNNLSLEEITRWGVTVGTANTQADGAGFVDFNLVKELLPQVSMTKIF